jgi:chromosome segregation ATPase
MPPEEKKEQPEPEEPPQPNGQPTAGEMAAIKAELEEDKKAIAAAQAAITEKDKRITELQASVSVVQQAGETAMAELKQVQEAHAKAVTKYLGMARAINPTIPGDVITGTTIDDIDASVAKASSIASSVKKAIEAEAKQARVPAGAPTRTEISLEGLSPREKIVAGIHQKGGTS